jgi:hypothetical protein
MPGRLLGRAGEFERTSYPLRTIVPILGETVATWKRRGGVPPFSFEPDGVFFVPWEEGKERERMQPGITAIKPQSDVTTGKKR